MRLISARPAAADAIADALGRGGVRVAFRDHRSFPAPEGLLPVVARMGLRTLLLTEFSLVRRTVAGLRETVRKDEVGTWGEDARIVVANYERAGLYLRFLDPASFGFLAMMEHGPENARAASEIAAGLEVGTALQVLRTHAPGAFDPDVTLTRDEDGRIERADRAVAAAA